MFIAAKIQRNVLILILQILQIILMAISYKYENILIS